ncbi:MAG: diacylglycerol/lipid kinase family protein [Huintestinicola sp.]
MLFFIVNNTSGNGRCRNMLKKVTERLSEKNAEYKLYRTEYKGHATEIAEKLSKLPAERITIVVIGGDGTINEVLNGISDFEKVRLGIIPAGSGNDFARGLKIGTDINELVDKIIFHHSCDKSRRVDIGRVSFEENGSRLFGISSGIGMDAIVCKEVSESRIKKLLNKLHLGKLSYILMTIYTLFSMETAQITAEFGKEKKTINDVIYFVGMNLRAEGGGVPMAPAALPDDGLLSFSSAAGIPKWRTFLCLPFLVMAKQERLKGFEIFPSEYAAIETSKPMILHADGEYLGQFTKINYQCLPGILKIIN